MIYYIAQKEKRTIGSLSTRVFETRTAIGSKLFSLLTCLHKTTFTLPSIFSPLENDYYKNMAGHRYPGTRNVLFRLPPASQKTHELKLPNGNSDGGRRSTFAGNSALLLSDVIDFAMLPAQRRLAGNSLIVRCHVTSKKPMGARALLGKKIQLYNELCCSSAYHARK